MGLVDKQEPDAAVKLIAVNENGHKALEGLPLLDFRRFVQAVVQQALRLDVALHVVLRVQVVLKGPVVLVALDAEQDQKVVARVQRHVDLEPVRVNLDGVLDEFRVLRVEQL